MGKFTSYLAIRDIYTKEEAIALKSHNKKLRRFYVIALSIAGLYSSIVILLGAISVHSNASAVIVSLGRGINDNSIRMLLGFLKNVIFVTSSFGLFYLFTVILLGYIFLRLFLAALFYLSVYGFNYVRRTDEEKKQKRSTRRSLRGKTSNQLLIVAVVSTVVMVSFIAIFIKKMSAAELFDYIFIMLIITIAVLMLISIKANIKGLFSIKRSRQVIIRTAKMNSIKLVYLVVFFIITAYIFIPLLLDILNYETDFYEGILTNRFLEVRERIKVDGATDEVIDYIDNIESGINNLRAKRFNKEDYYRNIANAGKYVPSIILVIFIFEIAIPASVYLGKKNVARLIIFIVAQVYSLILVKMIPQVFNSPAKALIVVIPLTVLSLLLGIYLQVIIKETS